MQKVKMSIVEYQCYLNDITGKGYQSVCSNSIVENSFTLYRCNEHRLLISYYPSLEIMTEYEKPSDFCLNDIEQSHSVICEPKLILLGVEIEKNDNNGMGIIIRLENGKFIIIDGGYKRNEDACLIYNTLIEQSLDPNTIVISAWIITHTHNDHCGAFMCFTEMYRDKITVERFLFRPSEDNYPESQTRYHEILPSLFSLYDGAEICYVHTGQRFAFGGAELEFLFTPENLLEIGDYTQPNTNSLVFTIEYNGQKLLITGDATDIVMKFLKNSYGEYLKCDLLQAAHHGAAHGDPDPRSPDLKDIDDFYELTDPNVVLWPTSQFHYQNWVLNGKRPGFKVLMNGKREHICSGNTNKIYIFSSYTNGSIKI